MCEFNILDPEKHETPTIRSMKCDKNNNFAAYDLKQDVCVCMWRPVDQYLGSPNKDCLQ